MSIESLKTLLETAKFNVFLNKAPNGTACPYVVLEDVTHPNFAADNSTFAKTTSLKATLVESEVHDWTLISSLEAVFDSVPLPYNSDENQDTDEKVCETYFYISFLGGTTNV
ncbi:MAG: hypothetical protein IKH20_11905 [Clostridiales bacterium]|nr:hypothetical protein [Clostridiales bacterium]